MKSKNCRKIIAFMLAVAISFSTISAVAESDFTEPLQQETAVAPLIRYEDIAQRSVNAKRFVLSDGSELIAQYDTNVHYEEDGAWQDIDNTFEDVPTTADTEDFDGVQTRDNKFKVKFSNKADEKKLYRIKYDDSKITWGLIGANSVRGEATYTPTPKNEDVNEKFTNLKKVTSKMTYPQVKTGVDLEYIVDGTNIKENIVITEPQNDYTFAFRLELQKATLVENGDGSLSICKTDGSNKILFTIPAPYMYDAAMERSDDVHYTVDLIKANGNKQEYIISIVVNPEWFEREDIQYPVVIDPVLISIPTVASVRVAEVRSNYPNQNYSTGETHYIGYRTDYGKCRLYCNFALPDTLKVGDKLVGAYLNICQVYSGVEQADTAPINVYEPTSSWSDSTITWNNQPGHGIAIDQFNLAEGDAHFTPEYKTIDITKAAIGWINGNTNNGILLQADYESNQTTNKWGQLYTNRYQYGGPELALVVRNHKGLEGYWTNHSYSFGRSGTGYVDDYTGNLVYVYSDLEESGSRMPLSVSHIYDGYLAGKEFTTPNAHTAFYGGMKIGNGWKLSLQQSISKRYIKTTSTSPDQPPESVYCYTDADGTEHCFYHKDDDSENVYIDEDGLELTLTLSTDPYGFTEPEYTITDKSGGTMKFDQAGLLYEISDASGNKITLSYGQNGRLLTATDGAGRVTTFNYNENNHLSSIVDPAGRITKYEYTVSYNSLLTSIGDNGSWLRRITRPDGYQTTFNYDANGYLTMIQQGRQSGMIDNDWMEFRVNSSGVVTQVGEYYAAAPRVEGQKVGITHPTTNQTVYRTSGSDDVYGNDDDIYTYFCFDQYGRTVSTYSLVDGRYSSSTVSYSAGDIGPNQTGNPYHVNKLKTGAMTNTHSVNLLKNSSVERNSNWTAGVWGEAFAGWSAAITADESYIGEKSLKISATTAVTGSSPRYYQDITLPAGTYTLSGYVKAEGISTSSTNGAFLCAYVWHPDGDQVNMSRLINSVGLSGASSALVGDGWQRVTVTFTLDAQRSVRISAGLKNCTGTAYFDALQLEKGDSAGKYNIIENSSFENGLEQWTNTIPTDLFSLVNDDAFDGSYAAQATGGCNKTPTLLQHFTLNDATQNSYLLSGWAKADSLSISEDNGRTFRIQATIIYTDSTQKVFDLDFNPYYDGWQYGSVVLIPESGKTINKIGIVLDYKNNMNNVKFDYISLIRDEASTYTYDDNGNPISVVQNASTKSSMEFNSSNDLTMLLNPTGYDYQYTYDDSHRVTSATSEAKVQTNFTYNSYGLVTGTTVQSSQSQSSNLFFTPSKLYASATYTNDGNYVASVTDNRGKTTQNSYDLNRGLLTNIVDPKGNKTYYSYNTDDTLSLVCYDKDGNNSYTHNIDTAVTYNYTNEQLVQINRLSGNVGLSYNFSYNPFRQLETIKIGNRTLINYAYKDNNGKLDTATYGNGSSIRYEYDAYERVKAIYRNSSTTPSVKYKYDSFGNLLERKDTSGGLTTYYEYDSSGRLAQSYAQKIGGIGYANIGYEYDQANRVKNVEYRFYAPYGEFSTGYTYGPDSIVTGISLPNGTNITQGYDSLGRKVLRYVNGCINLQTGPMHESYSYAQGAGGSDASSTLVSKIDYGYGTDLFYNYDNNGNITSIAAGSVSTPGQSYTYDGLNQLTSESDYQNGFSRKYYYDLAGNITRKELYAAPGFPEPTYQGAIVYEYGDANWPDLLTKYNGQTITYDAIGNPLQYRDGMTFTWENGRQLKNVVANSNTVGYTYNADGIRIRKSGGSNGLLGAEYYVNGSQIVYEVRTRYNAQGNMEQDYITYMYDEAGAPIGLRFNNTSYYFQKNLQGDIIAIYDSGANLVAQYVYDAWGKIISIKDGSGNLLTAADVDHIGNLNPFRYRGYFYDDETGFYYLNSRYYDPETGRFINADGQINDDILGTNLFAYCGNNPVTRADDTGRGWWVVAGALIGGIAGGVTKIVSNVTTGKKWNEGVIGAVVGGAVYGGVLAATGSVCAAGFASAAAESLTNEVVSYIPKVSQANGQTVTKKVTTGNVIDSAKTVLNDTAVNGTVSAITGKIAKNIVPTNNGWFEPQKFVSSFVGKYAIKSELQTLTQSALIFGYNGFEYSVNQRFKQGQQPIVTFFPDTEIRAAG